MQSQHKRKICAINRLSNDSVGFLTRRCFSSSISLTDLW